jgi:hypothetical protein
VPVPADDYVDLSGARPAFIGSERAIFEDPRSPETLIKVCKAGHEAKASRRGDLQPRLRSRWSYSQWRYGEMRGWQREYEEYIALLWRTQTLPSFVARYYGFCQTSRGPGMVVEKVRGPDGGLAATLRAAFDGDPHDPRLPGLIEEFFDALIACGCVVKDLHPNNIAVAGSLDRLVLVDGLGDGVVPKIKKVSGSLRQRYFEAKRQEFLAKLDRAKVRKDRAAGKQA